MNTHRGGLQVRRRPRKKVTNEELRPHIEEYMLRGKTDQQIAELIMKNHFPEEHLTAAIIKKSRKAMNLLKSRGAKLTAEDFGETALTVMDERPNVGRRELQYILQKEYRLQVTRDAIGEFQTLVDPAGVAARSTSQKEPRGRWWSTGVHEYWAFDQHDKLKKWGLFLHLGQEAFSGGLLWLKAWSNNRNPRLILTYYLEAVEKNGYRVPLYTQSDYGVENRGIANAQTLIRHRLDPDLAEARSLMHQWKPKTDNIRPEQAWAQFRRRCSNEIERFMEIGVTSGYFDHTQQLDVTTFQYIAMPYIQDILDSYVERLNRTRRRKTEGAQVPNDDPLTIMENPEDYGVKDYSVQANAEIIEDIRRQYVDPDHPVFRLVPPDFALLAEPLLADFDPDFVPTRDNVWPAFIHVRNHLRAERLDPRVCVYRPGDQQSIEETLALLDGYAQFVAEDPLTQTAAPNPLPSGPLPDFDTSSEEEYDVLEDDGDDGWDTDA